MGCHTVVLFLVCAFIFPRLTMAGIAKLHFPYESEKDVFPRVRIKSYFSSLSSFTLCQWVKPIFDGREMAIFSYGVPGQDREILLSLNSSVRLYVGGNLLLDQQCNGLKPVYWISGAWYYICVTWTSTQSSIRSFVNGIFCSKASSEYSAHKVPGNGVMVLGQDLKGLDTSFHKNNSWSGDIAGVQMWDEVLTYEQIVDHGRCKGNKEGNVVAWMKTPMIVYDEVILSVTDVCDVLKKIDI
uniref:Pentraxin family member n=1 Tax=Hadrurus spadix TaxID=141984 RepID=A0A1W7RAQ7_9SCOR